MLLPHDWVVSMLENGMIDRLSGAASACDYWSQQDFEGNPQLKQAAAYWGSIDHGVETVIPFMLHGDAAPHTETDSLYVMSMRSILSKCSVQISQLLLAAFPKAALVDGSLDELRKILVWSFKALAEGKHPSRNHNGRQFAADDEDDYRFRLAGKPLSTRRKIRGVILAIGGDYEFFCQEFGFPYAMSNHPCPFCKCDNKHVGGTMPFSDFRKDAL